MPIPDAKNCNTAASSRHLDGLGYPVQRGRTQDKVRIEMPRCGSCRSWVGVWIAVLAIVTLAAAIAGTIIQSFAFPEVAAPAWLKIYHHGIGNVGTGIGLVLGFVAALWERHGNANGRAGNRPTPILPS